jgi:esterase/lipase
VLFWNGIDVIKKLHICPFGWHSYNFLIKKITFMSFYENIKRTQEDVLAFLKEFRPKKKKKKNKEEEEKKKKALTCNTRHTIYLQLFYNLMTRVEVHVSDYILLFLLKKKKKKLF